MSVLEYEQDLHSPSTATALELIRTMNMRILLAPGLPGPDRVSERQKLEETEVGDFERGKRKAKDERGFMLERVGALLSPESGNAEALIWDS